MEDAQPKLEIAIVVDGTDSMAAALNGVRSAFSQMAEDLARYKDRVSFQLVVYRDGGGFGRNQLSTKHQ
ncbi:MAG: hypothetical protein R3C28_14230 [Pirellulaceae bacterium]